MLPYLALCFIAATGQNTQVVHLHAGGGISLPAMPKHGSVRDISTSEASTMARKDKKSPPKGGAVKLSAVHLKAQGGSYLFVYGNVLIDPNAACIVLNPDTQANACGSLSANPVGPAGSYMVVFNGSSSYGATLSLNSNGQSSTEKLAAGDYHLSVIVHIDPQHGSPVTMTAGTNLVRVDSVQIFPLKG